MQTTLDHIVETALARPSLAEVSKDELLILTQEFPYASVLQFLYTKKLQESGDPRFGNSVTRTALFFNNPHWLHQQLRASSQEEGIKRMERALTGLAEPDAAAAIDLVLNTEVTENESTIESTSSASEAALIASLTETPDGTLLQSEEDAIHQETLENESTGTPETHEVEINDTYDDVAGGIDDFEPEEVITDLEPVSSDDDLPESPFVNSDVLSDTAEEAIETAESITTTSETTENLSDDWTENQIELQISEESSTGEASVEDIEAPSADIFSAEEAEQVTELETIEEDTTQSIVTEEETVDTHSLPASDLQDTEVVAKESESAPEESPSSLITVIAPVGSFDFNTIHTIKLSEENDNDDDDTGSLNRPEVIQHAETVSRSTIEPTEESTNSTETDQETDNDDDFVAVPFTEPEIQDDILTGNELIEETETSHLSGLEDMGFLPEELLEDAGVDPQAALVEEEPSSTTSEWLDEDHPDATDPRDTDEFEDHLNDFEPGDLIKMAGLDQHHETELSFEPLHLTDYFASVGVSLPPEEQADVIGRPSKSFTGWIRSMKRIHPEKTVVHFTPSESEQIRVEAEMSNEQEEVLTETMAGIYALQGLTNKAIDIYEKLSLLNPEKSAIFAAKISELKGRSS